MNLLLFDPCELDSAGLLHLTDRRADHLRNVLRVRVGDCIRVGEWGGGVGRGLVQALEPMIVHCAIEGEGPSRLEDTLLLAIPRPKVLLRCVEHATALGFGRILLVRSWRVDKSHLAARALEPEQLAQRVRLGLEQSSRTRPPDVQVFRLFRPFVEDALPGLCPQGPRWLAQPGAQRNIATLSTVRAPFTLAIGPEGGWVQFELDLLAAAGFVPVSMGPHALRVEAAVAALHGQLSLLRELCP